MPNILTGLAIIRCSYFVVWWPVAPHHGSARSFVVEHRSILEVLTDVRGQYGMVLWECGWYIFCCVRIKQWLQGKADNFKTHNYTLPSPMCQKTSLLIKVKIHVEFARWLFCCTMLSVNILYVNGTNTKETHLQSFCSKRKRKYKVWKLQAWHRTTLTLTVTLILNVI